MPTTTPNAVSLRRWSDSCSHASPHTHGFGHAHIKVTQLINRPIMYAHTTRARTGDQTQRSAISYRAHALYANAFFPNNRRLWLSCHCDFWGIETWGGGGYRLNATPSSTQEWTDYDSCHTQWRKDWVRSPSKLLHGGRTWCAYIRDEVSFIRDAPSTRSEWMQNKAKKKADVL